MAAAGHGDGVKVLRAALRDHQVVPAVLLVDVRRFGCPAVAQRTAPQLGLLSHQRKSVQVDLAEPDVRSGAAQAGCAHVIGPAVVIPEQRRIDAHRAVDPVRLRPVPRRIGGGDDEVAAVVDVGGDHVECAVMVSDCGRKYAAGDGLAVQRQLRRAIQHVPQLFPVDEIAAVKQRHARKIGKAGGHEIKVVVHAADGRIGIEAGKDRIDEFSAHEYPSNRMVLLSV